MDFTNNLSPLDILSKKTNKMSKRLDSDVLPSNASITSLESTETFNGVTDQFGYNQYGEWNPRRASSASSIMSRDSQDFSGMHRQTSIISTNSSIGGLLMSLKVDEEDDDEDEYDGNGEYEDGDEAGGLAPSYTNDTSSIHSAETVQQRELTLEEHRSEFENYYKDQKPIIIDDDEDDDEDDNDDDDNDSEDGDGDEKELTSHQPLSRYETPPARFESPPTASSPSPSSRHTRISSNGSLGSLTQTNTNNTVVMPPQNTATAEEHLSAGITFHEQGKLRESAYQFQTAANMGDPTAMLLYGLALRHGWGLRQNPEEAVVWLKRATSIFFNGSNEKGDRSSTSDLLASLGKAEGVTGGGSATSNVKKSRVGLALYELGMSYLHSWGAGKDEDSALQYFELAGTLGDGDALCEAANIWMKNGGNGRKKNLHRAAELYRQAEERGVVIVGNHWIYKDKYMPKKDKKKDKGGFLKKK